jgi:hypothetical protein
LFIARASLRRLLQQLRQLGDAGGDPARFVACVGLLLI